jgi:hypothetical protein
VEYSLPWGVDAGEARRRNFSSCRLTGSRLWAASIVGPGVCFRRYLSFRTGTMESLNLVILSLRRGLVLAYWLSLHNCLP